MSKILVIGQAPPAVKQEVPYCTTMMYDWLGILGISKEDAQDMFEWEAVYDKFPGHGKDGHLIPKYEQAKEHWDKTLKAKFLAADKVWILGNVALDYLIDFTNNEEWHGRKIVSTIHPSFRNRALFKKIATKTLDKIESLINN